MPHPISPPPGSFGLVTSHRFFLDLFSGKNAPIFHACVSLNVDVISPCDIELGFDILDDSSFEALLHSAWNGFVGGVWAAPPCKEYSRLKLRPNGPRALRTPAEPYGRANLTKVQRQHLDSQETIHDRGRQLLLAAFTKGALVGWETPPSAMTLLLSENTEMLKDWGAHCSHVAACNWGVDLKKSWLFCANTPDIQILASWCTCSIKHPSFAGVKTNLNTWLSSETAEYPTELALALAKIMTHKCSATQTQVPWNQPLQRPAEHPQKQHVNDGGGLPSSGDWTVPHKPDSFQDLRQRWLDFGRLHQLQDRVLQHLQQQKEDPPLSDIELNPMIQLMDHWCQQQGWIPNWSIPEGQHFRLGLFQQLAHWVQDADTSLHPHLHAGVPTGVIDAIPPSTIWPRKPPKEDDHLDPLTVCEGNWQGAEADPHLTQSLIDEEIKQGWVARVPGGLQEAKQRWPHLGVGKLNVVQAPGKPPRLVLDSSCCNVNQHCHLPETMILPTIADVRATFTDHTTGRTWRALSLDIRAAHKQVRLAAQDQGLVAFTFQGNFYHYKVAHFGAKFSAFWWSRVGSLLIRLLHEVLGAPHRLFIYVDDILLLSPAHTFDDHAWLTIVFLMVLGTPLSWRKTQLGFRINWIGWQLDLDSMTVKLMDDKVSRLGEHLTELLTAKTVTEKQLQQILGMLIWFTSIAKHLRPHLSEVYRCLYAPPATLFSIPAGSWKSFVSCLDAQAKLVKPHPHFDLPLGGQVVEISHQPVHSKLDIPLAPKTTKLQWIRIAVPHQTSFQLTKGARHKLLWFKKLLQRRVHIFPLAQPRPKVMRAAADAFAEANLFGIGGWIITSSQVLWFSEQWTLEQLRSFLPALNKDAQKYISAFEVLAQLALLFMAIRKLDSHHLQLCLPSSSDNTGAEAGINKMLTIKEPTSTFLQMISMLAFQHHIHLSISHIPGQLNEWADNLSRNRLDQWRAYPRFRCSLQDFFAIGRHITLHPPGEHPPWLTTHTYSSGS